MQPFDYRINVAQPMAGATAGIQSALQIAQGMDASETERARGELLKAQTLGAQTDAAVKQRALDSSAQLQRDIDAQLANPSTEGVARMMIKYPHLSEGFQRGLKGLDAEQQKARIQEGTQVYAAILNGEIDTGRKILDDTAAALREKGNLQQAETYERMSKLIGINPAGAETSIGMLLSTAMGPEKFEQTFKGLEDQRRARGTEGAMREEAAGKASKATSDAAVAAVAARFAESNAALDLQKKGWDITKLQEDVKLSKANQQLASLNAAAAREKRPLELEELRLKIAEAQSKRDGAVREKVATAEAGAANIDNMLNTVQRILKNRSLNDVVGSLEGKEYYPNTVAGTINPFGDGDERADAIAIIDTLGSQAFLSQIPSIKGMGALSNAEGDKLQNAFQNLKRNQSEKQFRENLNEASRLLLKGRENLSKSTGLPLPKADTPAAPGARPPLDSFFK